MRQCFFPGSFSPQLSSLLYSLESFHPNIHWVQLLNRSNPVKHLTIKLRLGQLLILYMNNILQVIYSQFNIWNMLIIKLPYRVVAKITVNIYEELGQDGCLPNAFKMLPLMHITFISANFC